MESSTIRCPHCRKKQPEPCPKRCGCGQSLVNLLATPNRTPVAVEAGRAEMAGQWRQAAPPVPPAEPVDNEW